MDWYCQVAISIYSKIGKNQVLVYYGYSNDLLSCKFSSFCIGFFSPSENIDAMTNILIFSLGGIFTGIIFGAAFLSVARTLNKKSILRNHMIIAAYGFILFYISGSAMAAQAAIHLLDLCPCPLLDCHVI